MNHKNDITRSHHYLIRKLNEVLNTFRELDSFVKVRLIIVRVYTAVSYGTSATEYKSWRSAVKSAWGLTSMCRSSVLEITTDVVPLYVIGLHALSFIKWCLSSESDVQYVTSYGLQHGRIACMSSIHSKNIQFCCEELILAESE